ncbi:MAG: hypothetical protein JSR60_11225 [Proteobacteria bacterium]|nr:hypothetical protein [Pseudomonadota bacterium]
MNNRMVLLGGTAIVAIGVAFGAGYYLSNRPAPESAASPAAAQMAPTPKPVAALVPAAPPATATQPAPSPTPAPRRRYADYASGEGDYAEPPPPPPRHEGRRVDHDPFSGEFTTFPMRHAGDGSPASPLTWRAQTEFGEGHEADLRIAILVPEPAENDSGAFWRAWSGRENDNLLPEVTDGTPVIVTGSASVILDIDPDAVDLEAPALLIVRSDEGRLVYRSRDVAPARGETWNSRGARWIFAPDAAFYRALRSGGRISFEVHSRFDNRDIRIPFDSDDFAPSARRFERDLARRMDAIGTRWEDAGRGRPKPPPPPPPPPMETRHPAPDIVPAPPASRPGDHGHRRDNNEPSANAAGTPPDRGGHDHRDRNRETGGTPPDSNNASATAPVPVTPPAPTRDHGSDAHGRGSSNSPPDASRGPDANKPVASPPPQNTRAIALIESYHPPAEQCGTRPDFSTAAFDHLAPADIPATRASLAPKMRWTNCRKTWLASYDSSFAALLRNVKATGVELNAVPNGAAAIKAHDEAKQQVNADVTQWQAYFQAFRAAVAAQRPLRQPGDSPEPMRGRNPR